MDQGSVRRGGGFGRGCLIFLGVLLAMALAAGVTAWVVGRAAVDRLIGGPDPVTVAAASLQGLREQNRLSAFAARYVAVVTTTQTRLGLSARKTMIMPGSVRYEVDLGRLNQRDVIWDAGTKKLTIALPPLDVVGPDVDLNNIREYGEGGVLMALTDSEDRLDAANRAAGQKELIRQAREPTPMRLAKDATRRAVERSFAMPLRAAGMDVTVEAYFPDERSSQDRERWDVSRSIEQVMKDRETRQAQKK
ncbi:DUF4230 domain-containing protein [Sphingomonas sp.]|uniref:DUF4230 domain-containing protein n=1 Tax=Sphingomonas sp. TaxID=28214 RepID=UPI001EBE7061|nr:DUF4230 domain-containing protein [Sphingomonas sp.]MBX3593819.1 DUF4230 domain-containing protein [Sphingomonas sp.]